MTLTWKLELTSWLDKEYKKTDKFLPPKDEATRKSFEKEPFLMENAKITQNLTNLKFEVMLKPNTRNSFFLLLETSY